MQPGRWGGLPFLKEHYLETLGSLKDEPFGVGSELENSFDFREFLEEMAVTMDKWICANRRLSLIIFFFATLKQDLFGTFGFPFSVWMGWSFL